MGSGAGSLVNYLLGISGVDPIREVQVLAPCVGGRVSACQQALRCKALEDAAQVPAVEPQLIRQLRRHDARTMRDLVHHPHLGE